ncbi:hypothetical protein, partial [Clostridium butyricum]|uniref:hypothetical protein n=1 Tax=Clostridium butyricum TaxID=1492 RepID=UPI00374F63F9
FISNDIFTNYLSIFSLIFLSILRYTREYYQEKGEAIRRADLIDNSFGTKLSIKSSLDYYSNDDVNNSLYKILINIFENCFFHLQLYLI